MSSSPLPPLERLVAAIRDPATTMEDLTRMVGPDPFEAEQQAGRMRRIDLLWSQAERLDNRWGSDPEHWPSPYREQYQSLWAASQVFERRFC